jgi:uncharacterized protein (UPF0210 family)
MSITVEEIFETVNMTLRQNFDIRTVTLGINLKNCMDRDLDHFCGRAGQRIETMGRKLNEAADRIEAKYGIPVINRRIAITPASILLEPLPKTQAAAVRVARMLDRSAAAADIDFIGGFGAHVQKGLTASDENLMKSLPAALSQTKRVCSYFNMGSTRAGLNMTAVERFGHILKDLAVRSKTGIGCAKVAVFANVPDDNPFMAGAHHGAGEGDYALNVGISGPGVVKAVVEQNPDCDLTELSEVIKRTVFKITRAGELIGREVAQIVGVEFGIVDISLAATPRAGDSVAEIIEAMGVGRMGLPGTTAALALLIDAVKKGGSMASGHVGGLSGTFIPVSEDAGMIRAVQEGALSLEKLEALTSVCSVGMDMFAIPGSTPADVISAIIADELAIGIVNNKTTSVRVIPVPGKRAGQIVHFGGLLGSAPVMPVARKASRAFVMRKGRMPAPLNSLRN